ncbi:MAG: LPS assembly lipoprotein LptE [Acidobacteriota bacterium]
MMLVLSICENNPSMPSRLIVAFCTSLLLWPAGCGYHTLSSAAHLPGNVHTLAIPSFKNNTQSYHTQAVFTEAIIREFNSRSSLRIVPGDDPNADATLRGTILTFVITPLTYDNTTGQTSSYLVTITARLELVDRHGKVLWQNPSCLFRQQYEQIQNLVSFIQEDSAATRRLARDFASATVADILESF